MANLEKICDAFEITIAQFFSDDESRLDLTKEQKEILEIWDGLDEKEREIFMTFIRSRRSNGQFDKDASCLFYLNLYKICILYA